MPLLQQRNLGLETCRLALETCTLAHYHQLLALPRVRMRSAVDFW